ncbi:MFS transporter [Streptantibioticus rubrisoli]|uniref:MFS transporter n=1 Tax=Streptantibioticus rubrisoli TaxID=1387313 RepID=A0ABT1P967_9ACTN|nr:MFS transporter [Streptantibioticus rubrisoli]MCQ4041901.1 MFS transporter [Streptantibioticus rubrisoli]
MPTLNKIRAVLNGTAPHLSGTPLTALRTAITAFFAVDGFVFAGWVVRIPAIKAQVGASSGALGLALLGVSAGAVATMVITGRLCHRFGSHPVTVGCAALLALSVALPPLTHSALALGLVLLVFGAAYGGLNVAMNSAAVELVRALRRPVMPGFHAAFSFGGLVGAGLGGLLAPHLSPTRHLLLLTPLALLVTAVAGRTLLRHPTPHAQTAHSAPARPRSGSGARWLVAVFGLIALCTAYGEGALADWSALHLTQDLGSGPGLAAAAYAPFALAMAVGRLSGTALLERFGQTRTLVLGGLTAASGMLLGALAPLPWLVLTGFAVTGLGLANIFPVAIARAGALAGPGGVAAASTFGYGGMLLGPPSIGFLAEAMGLPLALTTVALLAAVAALIAFAVRNAEPCPAD